jgi:alpha-amylase
VSAPHPISWADEERDLTAWLGNGMQKEAFAKLYDMKNQMAKCTHPELLKDWNYLQGSDHFYYMSTKYFSDGEVHKAFNPFDSPYQAFINYMNVLSDFKIRLNAMVPENEMDNEIAALHKLVEEKDEKIRKMEADILRLQKAKKRKITPRKKK